MSSPTDGKPWTFVTSHTQVLLCLAHEPDVRLRDVAEAVGITERAAQRIVTDLVEAGYVERTRVGRRNRYKVNSKAAMRHQSQQGHQIGELISLLSLDDSRHSSRSATAAD
jgi:DNA-binding IclR family transcriptional regulator